MGKYAMRNSIEMKETLRFLQDLSLNNNKEWFDANKDRYLAAKSTLDALAVELIDGIRSFDGTIGPLSPKDCTYRIYRDLRFSKDKTPYKTHMGLYINRAIDFVREEKKEYFSSLDF